MPADVKSGRFKQVTVQQLESEGGSAATIAILSNGKIDLVPNTTNGNSVTGVPPTTSSATNCVNARGCVRILGTQGTDGIFQSVTDENTNVTDTSDTRGNHGYSLNASTITAKRVAESGEGGNMWLTGDTEISNSSVAIEHVKFDDSRLSTTNPTLTLSGRNNVCIERDLVITSTDGEGGTIVTSSGPLYLNPLNGTTVITGNLQVDGEWRNVNTSLTTGVVTDDVVVLANTQNILLSAWSFDKDSTVSNAGVNMALTNVQVSNGAIVFPSGTLRRALATSATFPWIDESFAVTFNVAFEGVPGTVSKLLCRYAEIGLYWELGGAVSVNNITGNISAFPASPLATQDGATRKYRVMMRRIKYTNMALSVIQVFVNGLLCRELTAADDELANTSLTNKELSFGAGANSYDCTISFDDVRLEKVVLPSNAKADGAGVLIEGDGTVNSTSCDRSIVWRRNVMQESSDTGGAYWHVRGGQLVLTRVIDKYKRRATNSTSPTDPGVLLSSLPTNSANIEPHRWTMSAYTGKYLTADIVSGNDMTYTSFVPPWMGEWFNDSANLTSVANRITGAGPTFTGVTPVNGEVLVPASGTATDNTQYVILNPSGGTQLLDTTGITANDGYGDWTVEVRAKTQTGNVVGTYSVFMMGDDNTSPARIGVLCTGFGPIILTENASGTNDKKVNIAQNFTTGQPHDGNYHTYRLYRKQYTAGTTTTKPTDLFRFWYDEKEIDLTVGVNGVSLSGSDLWNTPITPTRAVIRLGTTRRTAMGQALLIDYIKVANGLVVPVAPEHTNNYFVTNYGATGYHISHYGANGIFPSKTGSALTSVLFTGTVKPITSLAGATGGQSGTPGSLTTAPFTGPPGSTTTNVDMVELATVGDPSGSGRYVSVWAWRGGRLLVSTGDLYNQTVDPVVSASEFVLGIYLSVNNVYVYVDGVIPPMSGWRNTASNNSIPYNAVVTLSTTPANRYLYVGARMNYTSGTTFNIAYKNWRAIDTSLTTGWDQIANTQLYRYENEYDTLAVTYGFRIADDESLELVKTQGSVTTGTIAGRVIPTYNETTGSGTGVVVQTINNLNSVTTTGTDPFVLPTDEWANWSAICPVRFLFVIYTTTVNTLCVVDLHLYAELESNSLMEEAVGAAIPYNSAVFEYVSFTDGVAKAPVIVDWPSKNLFQFNTVVTSGFVNASGVREVVKVASFKFRQRADTKVAAWDVSNLGLKNVDWTRVVGFTVTDMATGIGFGSKFYPVIPVRVVQSSQFSTYFGSSPSWTPLWATVPKIGYFDQ